MLFLFHNSEPIKEKLFIQFLTAVIGARRITTVLRFNTI